MSLVPLCPRVTQTCGTCKGFRPRVVSHIPASIEKIVAVCYKTAFHENDLADAGRLSGSPEQSRFQGCLKITPKRHPDTTRKSSTPRPGKSTALAVRNHQ